MHNTEEITVLKEGPQIAAKTLEPIGISDRSEAWGLWVRSDEEHATGTDLPHLLISSIPPASWPLAFQLQAYLSERPGSLRRLTGTLVDAEIDVIFAECGPHGYSHAALNAVCVADGLEDALKVIIAASVGMDPDQSSLGQLRQRLHNEPRATKDTVLRRLGILMLAFLSELEAKILAAHGAPSNHFLYAKAVDQQLSNGARDRFSRKRAPWHLSPEFLLNELSPQASLLKCLNQYERAGSGCSSSGWRDRARHIVDETKCWPATTDETDSHRTAVEALETLRSQSDATEPFAFYRTWRYHTFDVLRLRALEQLAFFWLYGEDTSAPMAFRYDERSQILKANDTSRFADAIDDRGAGHVTLPARSVASIDRIARFLRLSIFSEQTQKERLILIDLPYVAKPSRERAAGNPRLRDGPASSSQPVTRRDPISTRGFLHDLLKSIDGAVPDGSLRRVSNRLIDQSPTLEQGTVRLLLDVPPTVGFRASLQTVAEEIRQAIANNLPELGPDAKSYSDVFVTRDVRVVPYPSRRVFISMNLEFTRRKDIVRLLKSILGAKGIEPVILKSDDGLPSGERLHEQAITERVRAELRRCDGFLQLLTLRPEEVDALRRRLPVQLNYAWLAYEYGIADERGLCPIRVMDRNVPLELRPWFSVVRRDHVDLEFDTQAPQDDLEQQLLRAVEEVEKSIYDRPAQAAIVR